MRFISAVILALCISAATSHVLFSSWTIVGVCERPETGECSKAGACCGRRDSGIRSYTRTCLEDHCDGDTSLLTKTGKCPIRCRDVDSWGAWVPSSSCNRPATGRCSSPGTCCNELEGTMTLTTTCTSPKGCLESALQKTIRCQIRCGGYTNWKRAGNCERPESGECSEEDTCCGERVGTMKFDRECLVAGECDASRLERTKMCNVRCGNPNPCDLYPPPCKNGGTCTREGNGLTCSCPSGFTGHHCEDTAPVDPDCTPPPPKPFLELDCSNGYMFDSVCQYKCSDLNYGLFPPTATQSTCDRNTGKLEVPCCVKVESCTLDKLDLVVVVDSSSSVGPSNWVLQMNFVKALLGRSLDIGPDNVRVGLFRYNKLIDTTTQITLKDTTTEAALMTAIDQIPFNGSGTKTGAAIQHALDVHLTEANGDRPDVENLVLVITDGASQDDVLAPSNAIRALGDSKVFGVGIGMKAKKAKQNMLEIAGEDTPEYSYTISGGFGAVDAAIATIDDAINGAACGITCAKWSDTEE